MSYTDADVAAASGPRLRRRRRHGAMSYTDADVAAAVARMDKYRSGPGCEIGTALAVVGLSAERADKEIAIRDEMIRTSHRAGASLRPIAEASGLGRKTVTAIVEADPLALASEREELADPLDSLVGGVDVEPDDDLDAVIYGTGT